MEPVNGSRKPLLALVALQLVTLAVAIVALVRVQHATSGDGSGAVTSEDIAELQDEVDALSTELQNQVARLNRAIDELGSARPAAGTVGDAVAPTPKIDETTPVVAVIDRMAELNDLVERYSDDPIQREPVRKELTRVEGLLRQRGEAAIQDLATRLPALTDSKLQSRLLVNVVGQIDSASAQQLALDAFHDRKLLSGVRLVGANVAMKTHKDEIVGELVRLLDGKDDSFDRREDVAQFFKSTPDPRAAEALCRIAKNAEEPRILRRFVLQALGSYKQPEVIDTLKDVTSQEIHGELRAEALHSLNDALGRGVLEFLAFLKPKLNVDDPLRKLVIGYEDYWNKQPQ